MSGHNRWSTIKHKKAIADAKKSKGWTKLIKEITVAAKMGDRLHVVPISALWPRPQPA